MNHYELVVIYTPVLADDQLKEAIGKFRGIITDAKSKIVSEDHWGLKKLAYPIQKKSTGYYHITLFEGKPELISKMEVELRRDERVLRFLTVRLDKHGLEFNLNRKNRSGEAKAAKASGDNKPAKEKEEVA